VSTERNCANEGGPCWCGVSMRCLFGRNIACDKVEEIGASKYISLVGLPYVHPPPHVLRIEKNASSVTIGN
jgi:hypothetical protein